MKFVGFISDIQSFEVTDTCLLFIDITQSWRLPQYISTPPQAAHFGVAIAYPTCHLGSIFLTCRIKYDKSDIAQGGSGDAGIGKACTRSDGECCFALHNRTLVIVGTSADVIQDAIVVWFNMAYYNDHAQCCVK